MSGVATVIAYDDVASLRRAGVAHVPVPGRGASIASVLAAARDMLGPSRGGACGRDRFDLCLVHNTRVVPAGESPTIMPGDELAVGPRPHGLETWVLIGIALASAAVSALLITQVKVPKIKGGENRERRYGFNRVSSPAFAGDTIPVTVGARRRYGGKVIAKVPVEGEDGRSRLKILIDFGHGPIKRLGNYTAAVDGALAASTTGVYLQDQPLASFPSARISVRLGIGGQAVIPGFKDVEVLREVGVGGAVLRNTSGADRTDPAASGEAFQFTTLAAVNAAVARVRFESGLYQVVSGAQLNARRVQYRRRWRLHDAGGGVPGAWSAWTVVTVDRAEQSEFFSASRLEGLAAPAAVVDIQLERVTAEPTTADVQDRMLWDSLVEVTSSAQTYPGKALLAVELVAGEEISSEPSISAEVEGFAGFRIWDGVSSPDAPVFNTGYSNNPADVALAVLTNTSWGMGARWTDADVDFESLLAWWTRCNEDVPRVVGGGTRKRHRYNHVLDQRRDGIEVLRSVCRAGRCVPVHSGGKWRFIYDGPQATNVCLFTDGSIAIDDAADPSSPASLSYERVWTEGGRVVPNRYVAQFQNAARDDNAETVGWPALGSLWLATEPLREEAVRFEGITDDEEMVSQIKYLLKKRRFLTRTVTHTTTRPLVSVQPGERYGLACLLAGWSLASGRLERGATSTTVKLDRSVTLAALTSYTLEVVHADGSTDVRSVNSPAGTYPAGTPISVAAAFSQVPADFCEYAIGVTGTHVKPFTCTRVRVADPEKFVWEISGLEYDAQVFDDTADVVSLPVYSTLPSADTPPGPLEKLTAAERIVNGIRVVELAWRQAKVDAEMTASFRVFRRLVGSSAWVAVPSPTVTTRGAVVEMVDIDHGYQFRVVAVSSLGSQLPVEFEGHPTATLVYGLTAPPPPAPSAGTPAYSRDSGTGSYTINWITWEEAFVGPPPLPPSTPTDSFQSLLGDQVLLGTVTPPGGFPYDVYSLADAMVLSRQSIAARSIGGLRLAVAQPYKFYVRSVAVSGRLGGWVEIEIANPLAPPGTTVKGTRTFNLGAEGTLTNLTWNAGPGRLELTNPAAAGVYLAPEVDLATATASELLVWLRPENDHDDPALITNPLYVPSIAADQWAVIDVGPPEVVAMIAPPYPDDEHGWLIEARTHDGTSWTDWQAVAVGASISRVFRKYQLRVTLSRKTAPYRPALAGLVGVVVH